MEQLVDNWYLVFGFVAVLVGLVGAFAEFFYESRDKKIETLRKWLEYAVVEAEKQLGEKTGQLKLRLVYDMALSKFSWLEKLVSFEDFSGYVDEALEWMRKQLVSNAGVRGYVQDGNEERS